MFKIGVNGVAKQKSEQVKPVNGSGAEIMRKQRLELDKSKNDKHPKNPNPPSELPSQA